MAYVHLFRQIGGRVIDDDSLFGRSGARTWLCQTARDKVRVNMDINKARSGNLDASQLCHRDRDYRESSEQAHGDWFACAWLRPWHH